MREKDEKDNLIQSLFDGLEAEKPNLSVLDATRNQMQADKADNPAVTRKRSIKWRRLLAPAFILVAVFVCLPLFSTLLGGRKGVEGGSVSPEASYSPGEVADSAESVIDRAPSNAQKNQSVVSFSLAEMAKKGIKESDTLPQEWEDSALSDVTAAFAASGDEVQQYVYNGYVNGTEVGQGAALRIVTPYGTDLITLLQVNADCTLSDRDTLLNQNSAIGQNTAYGYAVFYQTYVDGEYYTTVSIDTANGNVFVSIMSPNSGAMDYYLAQ